MGNLEKFIFLCLKHNCSKHLFPIWAWKSQATSHTHIYIIIYIYIYSGPLWVWFLPVLFCFFLFYCCFSLSLFLLLRALTSFTRSHLVFAHSSPSWSKRQGYRYFFAGMYLKTLYAHHKGWFRYASHPEQQVNLLISAQVYYSKWYLIILDLIMPTRSYST